MKTLKHVGCAENGIVGVAARMCLFINGWSGQHSTQSVPVSGAGRTTPILMS